MEISNQRIICYSIAYNFEFSHKIVREPFHWNCICKKFYFTTNRTVINNIKLKSSLFPSDTNIQRILIPKIWKIQKFFYFLGVKIPFWNHWPISVVSHNNFGSGTLYLNEFLVRMKSDGECPVYFFSFYNCFLWMFLFPG